MTRIEIALGERSYAALIETGLIDRIGPLLTPLLRGRRLPVISDETVWAAQGGRLVSGLAAAGIESVPLLVPAGEGSKSMAVLAPLLDRLLALEVERRDHILAFGGGVVGDLAGFAAAILKRGCRYVQVPTTLVAQADSAIGGKTGINAAAGKNLVGAYHHPSLVVVDPAALATLPVRQIRAGYAEVLRYGLIGDADFFAWCEAHGRDLIDGDTEARDHAVRTCIAAKAALVAADERDTSGRRVLLNLGHTFGHALEAESGGPDRLLHGEAVAIGMALAFRFSAERGLCPARDADRVAAHLAGAGLPTGFDADPAAIVGRMRNDKKARDGRIGFVLVRGVGDAFLDDSVDLAEVESFLSRSRR